MPLYRCQDANIHILDMVDGRYLVAGGARCAGSSSSQSVAQVSMPRLQQQLSSRVAEDTGRYQDHLQWLSDLIHCNLMNSNGCK